MGVVVWNGFAALSRGKGAAMSIRCRVCVPLTRLARGMFPFLAMLAFGLSCGEEGGADLAAVPMAKGEFGALLASRDGDQLLPIVTRNASEEPIAVTGVVWMDAQGSSMVVDLDADTGLPTKAVFGDFIVLFANWSGDGTTADVARIYGPTDRKSVV